MVRLLQPERGEIPELYRRMVFRDIPVQFDAAPSRVIVDQGLRSAGSSALAYRWSVPYLIVLTEEPRIVGSIGGKGLLDTEDEVEIGYNVAADFRGRGIASRAVAEIITLARIDGISLIAHVEPDNEASRRALLRNSFKLEEIVRLPDSLDLERWTWSPD